MSLATPLIVQLQGLIERTYSIQSGVRDLARYLVGDAGYRALYRTAPVVRCIDSVVCGARMLVREQDGRVRASIYYPDALIESLERHPPQAGLDERNVDAFAALVEELDHFLLLASRLRQARHVSMFEMELQGGVTKHLVLARFLAGGAGELSPARRRWLRLQLFDKGRYHDEDPGVEQRYRQAARYAVRFIDTLPNVPVVRLAALRRFHGLPVAGKLEMIEASGR